MEKRAETVASAASKMLRFDLDERRVALALRDVLEVVRAVPGAADGGSEPHVPIGSPRGRPVP